MAKGQTDRQVQLLITVDELLRSLGEPIHYRDLCKALIGSGLWADPWGKEPDQILYSAIHNDVKKHKLGVSRFLFMGGGIFCTSSLDCLDELVDALPTPSNDVSPRDPFRRAGDMPGDAERRRAAAEAADADRRCGNCTHLSWDGPNLHTHECGSCGMYAQTKRATVFKCTEACPLWRARTFAQNNADMITPRELFVEAEHLRITGTRPKNSRFK